MSTNTLDRRTLDEQVAGLAVLTVHARADMAVCSRILQTFTVRRFVVERFTADFSRFEHREVRGLEQVRQSVMRISLVISTRDNKELERVVKVLNRIIDVYKVEHVFQM